MNGLRGRLGTVSLALLAAMCACTAPAGTVDSTATPTVTLTVGPGTIPPTAPPATSTQPLPTAQPTSTTAAFALPPTPGRTPPTQPYATIPPHITATPGEGDPRIEFFTASPADVDPGSGVRLSWKATGDKAILYAFNAAGQPDAGTIVPVESSTTVTTDSSQRVPALFMLTVFLGGQKTSATVQVALHCPDAWFFANPPAIYPSASATLSEGASEPFEHGRMLWVGATGTITVLYDKGSPPWSSHQNAWNQGDPETDPSVVPPGGLFQPVRGFGLLWRINLTLNDRLGWATEPETSFSIAYQCDASPSAPTCYISTPSGDIIQLKPGGSPWNLWTGP